MMAKRQVFKPSLIKRGVAWLAIIGAGGLNIALQVWLIRNWASQPSEERWSAVGVLALLFLPVLLGAASLRSYFVLTEDTVEIVRPFGTRVYRVADLGGYGRVTIVVNLVPLFQVRLYGFDLKAVGAISVNMGDRAAVDGWFGARLPLVVDEGSLAIPKPRYANEQGNPRLP